jgi:AraC-like DNA-binding protein
VATLVRPLGGASVKRVGVTGPEPVEKDSRGILDPGLLRQRVNLTRHPVGPNLRGLVDHFWAVAWDLPVGVVHTQQLLTHPGANISVGHPDASDEANSHGQIEARLNGVARSLTSRTLRGHGWAVAARTTPGGLGALITDPSSTFSDRVVPLGDALDLDETNLIKSVTTQPDQESRVHVLADVLEDLAIRAEPQRVRLARKVTEVARLAETDRSLRRLADLCDRADIGPRQLQRLFLEYAGVPPVWVLRRYRLIDAAEAVKDGQQVSWATIAADLGYADQAHLSRDFRAAIGKTPSAYAAAQSPD